MTEDNQRRNAAEERSRAETCLSEARALHAARALLFSIMIADAEAFLMEVRRMVAAPER